MSRRKDKKKKGMNPAVAVLVLLGSLAFVTRPLWSGGSAQTGLANLIGLEEPDMGEDEQALADAVVWRDLLATHGSYERGTPVRLSFALLAEPEAVAAAPAGEVAPTTLSRWTGEDPPLLRLGVVMISEHSRRAVLGGQVVGVGDAVAQGEVTSIEVGVVHVRWRGRDLTYDLDGAAPREFRDELARREANRQDKDGGGGVVAPTDENTEEEQG